MATFRTSRYTKGTLSETHLLVPSILSIGGASKKNTGRQAISKESFHYRACKSIWIHHGLELTEPPASPCSTSLDCLIYGLE